jgi:hypothetical protein
VLAWMYGNVTNHALFVTSQFIKIILKRNLTISYISNVSKYNTILKISNQTIEIIIYQYRLSIPYLKCLGPELIKYFEIFALCNEIFLGRDPSLSAKLTYFSYTLYTEAKGNFIQYF